MEEKDVLTYLKAKNQSRARRIALSALVALICLYILLKFQNFTFPFMDWMAAGAFLMTLLLNSDYVGWDNVTKKELLSIIEKQVNEDPEAQRVIAAKQAADEIVEEEEVALEQTDSSS